MTGQGTVLLIEDEQIVRDALAMMLRSFGFDVREAENGRVGVGMLAVETVDVILCDLRMPELDGLGVLEVVRRDHPLTPVIVVSGAGLLADAVAALKLGAFDYITKPVQEIAALDHAVRRAMAHATLLRENDRYRRELENANAELRAGIRRLEEDERAGRQIQARLLPAPMRHFGDHEVSHTLAPSTHMSGDFVDCFPIDESLLGFYLADVSGHGVPSAFVTVLLKSFMQRHLAAHDETGSALILSPAEILTALNREIVREDIGKHLTMFYGIIDRDHGKLTYASAGQFPWPILSDGTRVVDLEGRGLPVGLFDFAAYQEKRVDLPARFVLTLCSDGVLELLPQERLEDKIAHLRSCVVSLDANLASLGAALLLQSRRALPDDVTLLMIRKEAP